jgi:hypothetical protein
MIGYYSDPRSYYLFNILGDCLVAYSYLSHILHYNLHPRALSPIEESWRPTIAAESICGYDYTSYIDIYTG